tara:strand:+ start:503 stop:817 length:315 start_codon:yes stop_codon:yes gene_type:complete
MKIGDKDPINLKQFLVLIALGVVLALIWVLIDPALAIVLGIGAVGTWLVVEMRFKPRWIKAFWAWCIRFGQDPYSIRWWSFVEAERQREVERLREIEKKEEKKD